MMNRKFASLLLLLFSHLVVHADIGGSKNPSSSYQSERRVINTPVDQIDDLSMSASDVEPALSSVDNGDLLQRIRNGYGMDELDLPATAIQERRYASHPKHIYRMIDRGRLYLYHIVEEIQKRGMPTELALLPMIESAFDPKAYSPSKAAGIWQFIPSTGRKFGLKQNWWVDNRRDITAATDAALTYLQQLHNMFGTWELALAAYNAGEGAVKRAIKLNRQKGLPTDYRRLKLPLETRKYVPKLLAIKNIITHPERYGLNIEPIPNRPYFNRVEAPVRIDARLVAELAGVSMEELIALNPAYNHPLMDTVASGTRAILLPVGKDTEFAINLADYDKPLASWTIYQPQPGEKLSNISSKLGVSVAQLRHVNKLPANLIVKNRHPLLVPIKDNASDDLLRVTETKTAISHQEPILYSAHYVVKRGDNLYSISRRCGMTTRQLSTLNGLNSSLLRVGQKLLVAPIFSKRSTCPIKQMTRLSRKKMHYTVMYGETLFSIARKFNIVASDLQLWNNLNDKHILLPGHKLLIFKEDT